MPPLPDPKLTQAKKLADAGDWAGCLRIVAKFAQLGDEKAAITKGWAAHQHPQFYVDLGYDRQQLWEAAVVACCERYDWPVPLVPPRLPERKAAKG